MVETNFPAIPLDKLNYEHCTLFVEGICLWVYEERKSKEYCMQIWRNYKK